MKKIVLSLFVIIVFIGYALTQRQDATIPITTPVTTPTASQQPTPIVTSSQGPLPTATLIPTNTPSPAPTQAGQYKDGQYTGSPADAYYGNIQVKAIIQGGKITDVVFLQYPNDRGTSIEINSQAMGYLKTEAIQAQSANVDIVSGATDSSMAFIQSMQSALSQAQ